jgi:hypothetical protein
MDCEKFEPLLLDELYEELDELTSAALKRHVAGCARCSAILAGMTATRQATSLSLVAAPADLEDRILAAAKEAQKVVPIRGRLSGVVSVAGRWAMRPQTAMAAVFLLMVGTSAFLIRSKSDASKPASVSVMVEGQPAPVATPAGPSESLDDKAAAAAHGPTPPSVTRTVPAAPAAASAVALADSAEGAGPLDRLTGGAARATSKDEASALGDALGSNGAGKGFAGGGPAPAPTTGPMANAVAPAGAAEYAPPAPPPAQAAAKQDAFGLGMAAFRGRSYAEATRQFDVAAQTGDDNAALWAAESTREGQGCAVALGRFDRLAQRASGTWVGDEAALRAARCEMRMGSLDAARARLDRLAAGGAHQQAAQGALAELNEVASRRAGGGSGAAAGADAKPRAAAPAKAASPARAPEAQEQKKADDKSSGF